jgi:hypothetical protein
MNPLPIPAARRLAPSPLGCQETPPASATIASSQSRTRTETATQRLTLLLEGITAGDYLAWAHDPDPQTLGRAPRLLRVQADPLGNRIDVVLSWSIDPPPARAAAAAAGFALTPEVFKLRTSGR